MSSKKHTQKLKDKGETEVKDGLSTGRIARPMNGASPTEAWKLGNVVGHAWVVGIHGSVFPPRLRLQISWHFKCESEWDNTCYQIC